MSATHCVNRACCSAAIWSGMGEAADSGEGRRERRRVAMLSAARALFFERGYDAVSLGEIVRRSGGSLATLYGLFENKEGLLRAIVDEERFGGIERLDAIVARGESPATTLRAIADSVQQTLCQPETIRLMRVVMAKSLADPAFAHGVYEIAHQPRVAWLTELFARWAASGQARIPDPAMAAHFFLGLTLHAAQTRAMFGELQAPEVPAPEGCVAGAVALFVKGYAISTTTELPPA
jgi:TetR/AcrR family transcriptional regulator, mexJK operon transcriptional repressor